jgi:hypothetical protein
LPPTFDEVVIALQVPCFLNHFGTWYSDIIASQLLIEKCNNNKKNKMCFEKYFFGLFSNGRKFPTVELKKKKKEGKKKKKKSTRIALFFFSFACFVNCYQHGRANKAKKVDDFFWQDDRRCGKQVE